MFRNFQTGNYNHVIDNSCSLIDKVGGIMEILSLVAFGGLMFLCFITIPEIMEKRAAQH